VRVRQDLTIADDHTGSSEAGADPDDGWGDALM
jgi:hypothetical protein